MSEKLKNWKLTICYDGNGYAGWQRLGSEDKSTVQGALEHTLSACIGEPIRITGAGRTDAGVHAIAQTANFHTRIPMPGELILMEANRRLPPDIRITGIALVPNRFHSRFDSLGKTYEYHLETGERPDVFRRRYAAFAPGRYDVDAMQRAADLLTGTHNFRGFSHVQRGSGKEGGTVKTIWECRIEREGTHIVLQITGNGFLYHMVRLISGTLLEIGQGKRPASDISAILEEGKRGAAGPLMPGHGLFLKRIFYKEMEAAD